MNDDPRIFFLVCAIISLLGIILYQRSAYTKGIQAKIEKISGKLSDILREDSDEKVMVFTDDEVLPASAPRSRRSAWYSSFFITFS